MKRKVLICFDMDNTLILADRVHVAAYNQAFVKNGLSKVAPAVLKKKFGRLSRTLVQELFPRISAAKLKQVVADHDHLVVVDTKKYARVIPGVKPALRRLKKRYQLGLLTNCAHIEILPVLMAAGLDPGLFDVILGNDDVPRGKPWPDEILKAKRLAHLKAAYMVGDTYFDILAGKRAKAKTIGVLTGNQPKALLQRYKPDLILRSVADLPKALGC